MAVLNDAFDVELAGNSVNAVYLGGEQVWPGRNGLIRLLFGNGEQGVWYEPKPEYLYQDAAGTTPVTADGDPVGYMQDLSGNGNHATQSTSSARPVYQDNGESQLLNPDGVDDFVNVNDPLSYESFTIITAFRSSDFGRVIDNRGTGTSGRASGFYLRSDAISVDDGSGNSIPADGFTPPASNEVWTMTYNGSTKTLKLRRDGVETISQTSPQIGSILTAQNCRLFAAANNPSAQGMDGEFYGAIVREGALSPDIIAKAESYMATRAGITL